MAKPLSIVTQDGEIRFGGDVLQKYPSLTPLVTETIALASMIEFHWAEILALISNADPRAIVAMHSALTSTAAQRAAFMAVALIRMDKDRFLLCEAIRTATKAASDIRNRFCHHLWGECTSLQDTLLLIDPIAFTSHTVGVLEGMNTKFLPTLPLTIDRSKMLVYALPDLREARDTVFTAVETVGNFRLLLSADSMKERGVELPWHDTLLAQLVSQPQVELALQRKARKKSQ